MFKLEVTKLDNSVEHIYNMNSNEDDFLRFIPSKYGVGSDNLDIYMLPDSNKDEIEAYLQLGPQYKLDLGESGKIKVITVEEVVDPVTDAVEEVVTLIKEYVGTLIQYPYDDNGKFLGNGYEL